jgi:hypothetical protein
MTHAALYAYDHKYKRHMIPNDVSVVMAEKENHLYSISNIAVTEGIDRLISKALDTHNETYHS